MPVSRLTAEGLSTDVAAVYGRAELRLLRLLAKYLDAGVDSPRWAEAKLAELQMFRRRAQKIVREATDEATGTAGRAITSAYFRGTAAAQGDLDRAGVGLDTPPRHAEHAVEALVRAQTGTLEDIGPRVLRSTEDAYRDAVARASAGTLTGASTRRQDAEAALDDLARRGVTGFTDTAGRRWGLEGYVDMATRTTTAQAAVAGHLDRLQDAGLELVIVSNSSRECDRCRPWEGKVLSQGPTDVMQTNVLTGELERVPVDGTVREAISAGLMHPNCTHNLSGYVHGATKRDDATSNPEGYAEKQQQRALERKVREWKRREAAAMSPEAKRKAQGKVRAWQGQLDAHTKATGLPRKYDRESFDLRGRAAVTPLDVPVDRMDTELLDAEMADLMAADDYGPRFESLAAEMDRRDQETKADPWALPAQPDPFGEQALLDDLWGGASARRALEDDESTGGYKRKTKKQLEQELRDSYDTWVHTQWLRAEEECRGVLLSKEGLRHDLDPLQFFTRRYTSLRMASPELQEWFAQPGNERMSFPEFRAGMMDDKQARAAGQRRRGRGYESEFG